MNFYEIGKNYLISCIKLDYNLLFLNNNLLDFLKTFIIFKGLFLEMTAHCPMFNGLLTKQT